MAVVFRSLLLALHLLSTAAALRLESPNSRVWSTKRGVKWLEPGRSVLILLETPDLPLWNQEDQIGENIPSALILHFSLTPDNRTLLLQDKPFMPLPNPNTPPRLSAPQTAQTQLEFEQTETHDLHDAPLFDLDYDRLAANRDDPSIHYYNYNPTLALNLLGAGIAGYNALLKSERQKIIKITLKDWNTVHRATTDPPNHNFEITGVSLWERTVKGFPDVVAPDDLGECSMWSWRCSDFGDFPYYRFIFRQNFDKYGRIGSLRHMFLQRWGTLHETLGSVRLALLMLVVASMILSPVGYAFYRGWKRITEARAATREPSKTSAVVEGEAEALLADSEVVDKTEDLEKGATLEERPKEHEAEAPLTAGRPLLSAIPKPEDGVRASRKS